MNPFKFFKGQLYKPGNIRTPQRNYMGLERGQIKWIDLPVGVVYYMEAVQSVDPVDEYTIPQVNVSLHQRNIMTETIVIDSLREFLEENRNNYILVHEIMTFHYSPFLRGTIEGVPDDIPLILRAKVLTE